MKDLDAPRDPRELMAEAKQGDADAFGKLYELYFVPVFRYILRRVKHRETAEDLVQEVFLKVHQAIARFEERGKSPLAYFFTVARNTIIDYWRKNDKVFDDLEMLLEIPHPSDTPEEAAEKAHAAKMIRKTIRRLTHEQQEVIVLKFIDELPNRDIAALLGKTEKAVRQLQCRALKAMRQNLRNTGFFN